MSAPRRVINISPRFEHYDEMVGRAQIAEKHGIEQIWLEQQPDHRDALAMASAYLHHAPSASVGTAILPVYSRHPVAAAQAALTLAEMSGGRFTLGVGFSHQFINEYVLGQRQGPPLQVMREYLQIVTGLLRDGAVNVEGRHFTARAHYIMPRPHVPVVMAGMRPGMIRLAVEHCDGLALWLCPARYVKEQVMPVVRRACEELGKDPDTFTVTAQVSCYTGPAEAAIFEKFSRTIDAYRLIPTYRGVMEFYGPIVHHDLCIIGSESHVRERVEEYRDAGCVPAVSPIGDTFEEFEAALVAAYAADGL